MDTLDRYRKIVREVLTPYTTIEYANADIQNELVCDPETDRYLVVSVGWKANGTSRDVRISSAWFTRAAVISIGHGSSAQIAAVASTLRGGSIVRKVRHAGAPPIRRPSGAGSGTERPGWSAPFTTSERVGSRGPPSRRSGRSSTRSKPHPTRRRIPLPNDPPLRRRRAGCRG